ncbi:uncharacterized protein [Pyxicephalus adspersus]|uniref:uncharacterized protein isoform X2 n=1 Tax=Pyxicephalus adspersus TaxID=30357 RepID=UPI003B599323
MDHYLTTLGLMISLVNAVVCTEHCMYPVELTSSRLSAKMYMIGTVVMYQCEDGYEGLNADPLSYNCVKISEEAKWDTFDNCCITVGTENFTGHECETTMDDNFLSNENRTAWTDFCGPPPVVPLATINHTLTKFQLGQELMYSLNGNTFTEDGDYRVLKCMDCNKSAMWVNLTDGCPNRDDENQSKYPWLPRYIITCTVLVFMFMSLAIFGIKLGKEMSASKNLTKEAKSGCEEDNERYSTVVPLNEKK